MERASSCLKDSLDSGAFGLSVGLIYVPDAYWTADEIADLASVMKGGKGILCAHIRAEGERLAASVREVINIAKQAEVPLEISHFKAAGEKAWHGALCRAIEIIEAERAGGFDVTVDFYPYDCGSSTLMQMLPPSYLAMGLAKAVAGLADSANVEKIRRILAEGEADWDNLSENRGWDHVIISSVNLEENRRFMGKSVAASAREYGYRDEAELAAGLLHSENGKVAIINRILCQEDIDTVARLPYSSLISDSLYGDLAHAHPRLYGAFPRFLADFVRERKVLELPAAIRKMTSMPARRVGLKDRGLLRPGYRADILVFDPANFRDEADYDSPAKLSTGLYYVHVAGTTGNRAGTLTRPHHDAVLSARR
jgi:N-acyl-D-aspartate/D-glutamate deacylase